MKSSIMFCKHLLFGSKPVIKAGHGANADVPGSVSGQHSQPSHVPLQYFTTQNKDYIL